MAEDERIAALEEVATDENEYSGWVGLAQGALDVLEERDGRIAELKAALRKIADPESAMTECPICGGIETARAALKGKNADA